MACITIIDRDENYFCFACTTSGSVFGPLMEVPEGENIDEVIKDFREYLGRDPRIIDDVRLNGIWLEYWARNWGDE